MRSKEETDNNNNNNSSWGARNSTLIMVAIITCTLVLTGGAPISNLAFKALEKVYDVEFGSYNLNHNLKYLREAKGEKELQDSMRIEVNDVDSLITILDSKNTNMLKLPTDNRREFKYRIDGKENIDRYFRVLQNLKIGTIVIENSLFNEDEMVIVIR